MGVFDASRSQCDYSVTRYENKELTANVENIVNEAQPVHDNDVDIAVDNGNPPRILQVIANVLARPQEQQLEVKEQNIVHISTYVSRNQDPLEWLDSISRAFEANNILGARKLAVVGAHLIGLAALWWQGQHDEIRFWDND
ncbi:hypothetical protein C2G38_2163139 [Gigaspora rosea]|uniref:Uncharacterized protein n=1 Tax=Gigaspora rosea TaxID=44941 RepID=A0A397VX39_9GLOM|nr:hypothetical protein C2G38_2163139 [Gigaspora rosea]